MYVVLIGRPGVGKGTQSKRLAECLGLLHIATGDLLREERRKGTPRSQQISALIDKGHLVSDELVLELVRERLPTNGDAGCIFDGIPRTMEQAELLGGLLAEYGATVGLAVELEVSAGEATARMLHRAELEGRADDTPETIRHRMLVYERDTFPLIGYYQAQGVLQSIDGTGNPDEVFARLLACAQAAQQGPQKS